MRERYGTLCLNTRKPDSYSQGICSSETPRESATKADEYVYKVRLRNSGPKTIKTILWDYVFIDPQTGKELARHSFYNESQLSPGKSKTLTATSVKPPTRVITVGMLFNNNGETYRERIEIKRIAYADGSVWQAN